MSVSWSSILKRNRGRNLLEVRSSIKGGARTIGFIVGYSDDLILFHVLNTDSFCLNGYSVVRSEDVKDYRVFDKSNYWQHRAVRRYKFKPVRPAGILLTSVSNLLESIAKRYSLTTIHIERIKPDVCYIGPLLSATRKTFTIDDLD